MTQGAKARLSQYQWRELPQVSFLSRQTRVCRDKSKLLLTKIFCCDKYHFVATSKLLSRQKMGFVATKMILVAAPASDIAGRQTIAGVVYGIIYVSKL